MAMESEWARKLKAAQLEALQKLKDLEQAVKAKSAEAQELAGKAVQLDKAVDTIQMLEQANDQERQATAAALQRCNDLQQTTQVSLASPSMPKLPKDPGLILYSYQLKEHRQQGRMCRSRMKPLTRRRQLRKCLEQKAFVRR